MGDISKFQNIFLYYSFNLSLLCMIVCEIFIFIYTFSKNTSTKKINLDKGTKWLLYANFMFCIYISFYIVSKNSPEILKKFMLSSYASYFGIIFMISGLIIRIIAVLALKKSFTLNVQTTNTQKLVTTGIYSKVRNPAYTGSILCLIGVAISLRNVLAISIVLLLSLICYKIRISIEEKVLENCFKHKFKEYADHTYKLFPYIW